MFSRTARRKSDSCNRRSGTSRRLEFISFSICAAGVKKFHTGRFARVFSIASRTEIEAVTDARPVRAGFRKCSPIDGSTAKPEEKTSGDKPLRMSKSPGVQRGVL